MVHVFKKKIKRKENRGKEKESVGDCQLSAAATTLSLMLTVCLLGHLSRTSTAKDKDSSVKDLVFPKTREERKGGRERERGQKEEVCGKDLMFKFTDAPTSQPPNKPIKPFHHHQHHQHL